MIYAGVIGSGNCDQKTGLIAYQVGRHLALQGAILICGGKGGVMEQACLGCKEAGGVSLGILPEKDRHKANKYVTYALATGLGELRNFLVVQLSDVLISVSGEYGTLSEMALALKEGKRVIALNPPLPLNGLIQAASPEEAVEKALQFQQELPSFS